MKIKIADCSIQYSERAFKADNCVFDIPVVDQQPEITKEVKCGEDFCDACGDCLHCYGEDLCWHSEDGKHTPMDLK